MQSTHARCTRRFSIIEIDRWLCDDVCQIVSLLLYEFKRIRNVDRVLYAYAWYTTNCFIFIFSLDNILFLFKFFFFRRVNIWLHRRLRHYLWTHRVQCVYGVRMCITKSAWTTHECVCICSEHIHSYGQGNDFNNAATTTTQ